MAVYPAPPPGAQDETLMEPLVIEDMTMDRIDAWDLPPYRGPAEPGSPRDVYRQPLWLSEAEAEQLLALCFSAACSAGEMEPELFARLGELVRSFRR